MTAVALDETPSALRNRLAVLQLVRVVLAVAVVSLPPLVDALGAPLSVPLAYRLPVTDYVALTKPRLSSGARAIP